MNSYINIRLKFFILFLLFFSYNHYGNFNFCFLTFNFVFGALFFPENITLWWFKDKYGSYCDIMQCNLLNLRLSTSLLIFVIYVICSVHVTDYLCDKWNNDSVIKTMFYFQIPIFYLFFKNPFDNWKYKDIF